MIVDEAEAVKNNVDELLIGQGSATNGPTTVYDPSIKPGDKVRNALHFTAEFMVPGKESSARDRVD